MQFQDLNVTFASVPLVHWARLIEEMEDFAVVDRELESSDSNPHANGDVGAITINPDGGVEEEDNASGSSSDCCLRCCSSFCFCSRKVVGFLLRHVGLMAVVVGYCFLGGFVFEKLEKENEWLVVVQQRKFQHCHQDRYY